MYKSAMEGLLLPTHYVVINVYFLSKIWKFIARESKVYYL